MKIFSAHPSLHITYEDLYKNHNETIESVLDFLGAEKIVPKTSLKKMNSNALKDIIINYNEIKQALSNTQYANFFDTD